MNSFRFWRITIVINGPFYTQSLMLGLVDIVLRLSSPYQGNKTFQEFENVFQSLIPSD